MSANQPSANGRVQVLLWINTVLTALILPVLGFVGVRLWDQVDAVSKAQTSSAVQIELIRYWQRDVTETLTKLLDADKRIEDEIENHLKDVLPKKTGP